MRKICQNSNLYFYVICHSFVIPHLPPCVPSKGKYAITRNLHPTSAPYRKYKNQERSCFAKLKYKIGKYEIKKKKYETNSPCEGWLGIVAAQEREREREQYKSQK